MFSRILCLIGLVSICSTSSQASIVLTLSPLCEARVRSAVLQKISQMESASIEGLKLLYGGSDRGLHYASAVLVRVGSEVEPIDYLVLTDWVSSEYASQYGCKITQVKLMNEGSLPDVPGLE